MLLSFPPKIHERERKKGRKTGREHTLSYLVLTTGGMLRILFEHWSFNNMKKRSFYYREKLMIKGLDCIDFKFVLLYKCTLVH